MSMPDSPAPHTALRALMDRERETHAALLLLERGDDDYFQKFDEWRNARRQFEMSAVNALPHLLREREEMRKALQQATSDQTVHYMKAIYRRMREFRDHFVSRSRGATLADEAFADEIDWLDCHIDWSERTARAAIPPNQDPAKP